MMPSHHTWPPTLLKKESHASASTASSKLATRLLHLLFLLLKSHATTPHTLLRQDDDIILTHPITNPILTPCNEPHGHGDDHRPQIVVEVLIFSGLAHVVRRHNP